MLHVLRPGPPQAQTFPEPWESLFRRATSPCRCVFTYQNLGEDLLTAPNADRRAFFVSLIKLLGWPKGSISFWPVSIPSASGPVVDPAMFWSGVERLGATRIAVFGCETFRVLFPGTEPGRTILKQPPYTVIALPEPEDMARLLPHERYEHISALAQGAD